MIWDHVVAGSNPATPTAESTGEVLAHPHKVCNMGSNPISAIKKRYIKLFFLLRANVTARIMDALSSRQNVRCFHSNLNLCYILNI